MAIGCSLITSKKGMILYFSCISFVLDVSSANMGAYSLHLCVSLLHF
jgi:hypothetical protein